MYIYAILRLQNRLFFEKIVKIKESYRNRILLIKNKIRIQPSLDSFYIDNPLRRK